MAIHETQNVKVVIFCHNSSQIDYCNVIKTRSSILRTQKRRPGQNKPKPAFILPTCYGPGGGINQYY